MKAGTRISRTTFVLVYTLIISLVVTSSVQPSSATLIKRRLPKNALFYALHDTTNGTSPTPLDIAFRSSETSTLALKSPTTRSRAHIRCQAKGIVKTVSSTATYKTLVPASATKSPDTWPPSLPSATDVPITLSANALSPASFDKATLLVAGCVFIALVLAVLASCMQIVPFRSGCSIIRLTLLHHAETIVFVCGRAYRIGRSTGAGLNNSTAKDGRQAKRPHLLANGEMSNNITPSSSKLCREMRVKSVTSRNEEGRAGSYRSFVTEDLP